MCVFCLPCAESRGRRCALRRDTDVDQPYARRGDRADAALGERVVALREPWCVLWYQILHIRHGGRSDADLRVAVRVGRGAVQCRARDSDITCNFCEEKKDADKKGYTRLFGFK